MSNIVYRIVFNDRITANDPPFYYVGSKSKCEIVDGEILSENGSIYWGSSKYKGYHDYIGSDCEVELLERFSELEQDLLIPSELKHQRDLNVVESPEYFNLAYATHSTFTTPGMANYRHKDDSNKRIRLKTDDPLVKNETYIPILRGRKIPDHMVKNWVDKVASQPKSKSHRAKISRLNLVMVFNTVDVIVERINRNDVDPDIHISYNRLIAPKQQQCKECGTTTTPVNILRWHGPNCEGIRGRSVVKPQQSRRFKSAVVDGTHYTSIKSICEATDLTRDQVKLRLESPKYPNYIQEISPLKKSVPPFESLSTDEYITYTNQAESFHQKGFFQDQTTNQLAERIYYAKHHKDSD